MRKYIFYLTVIMIFMGLVVGTRMASAGPFSKVKKLKKSLVQTKEEWQRGSDNLKYSIAKKRGKIFYKTATNNPITGEWGTDTTCPNPHSPTCRDGKDHFANCMHQMENYYYRLVADHFEKKLANDMSLSNVKRKELQEDLVAIKDAINTGRVVDPDPADPNRWMFKIPKEAKQQMNWLNSEYIQEVTADCEKRFGVMGRYNQ